MPPITSEATPLQLARALEEFLGEHPRAALLEDGRVLFDMPTAHYSISSDHGRCALHVWSEDRNLVRTIVGIEPRKDMLRLSARRFGQSKPQTLQLVPDRDQRTPSTRDATRKRYLHTLERVLTRAFPELTVDPLRTAMDLEHSFGPAYARGALVRGQQAWALIAVNSTESPSTIDGILTLGILWFDHCRNHAGGRRLFQGLKVIVPAGCAELTRSRMAWLAPGIARWRLFELDERNEELTEVEIHDANLDMRLVHAFNPANALSRCQSAIDELLALVPPSSRERIEIRPTRPTEISFQLHGLEFARARHTLAANSFAHEQQLTFGAGANETPLIEDTQPLFLDLFTRLLEGRQPTGTNRNPLYRLQPERWLESELRHDLQQVIPGIQSQFIYQQVPAFAGGDRGMLDLLAVNDAGRLVVVELKADEDLHLPLQGLDYWLRVRQINATRTLNAASNASQGELQRYGYFPGMFVAEDAPMLAFVAPALRIHPANETVLRYFSPQVQWTLVALAESWREQRKVVFRKHCVV